MEEDKRREQKNTMSIADEPAFPCGDNPRWVSLTKRQYFASQALAGLLTDGEPGWRDADAPVQWAVKCADALIAELEKGAK